MVTGGWDGSVSLSSTEIYLESTSTWSIAAALPSGRSGLSAATLDNSVFVFGKDISYISLFFLAAFVYRANAYTALDQLLAGACKSLSILGWEVFNYSRY